VTEEEVMPQDIAVLSSQSMEDSKVGRSRLPDGLRFSKDPPPTRRYVRFSSIRAFKGLEAPVVVFCELEDLDGATRDSQIYVGMSRARNHCIVVAPATTP
jgi:superfamily I DNA/RNA helicase